MLGLAFLWAAYRLIGPDGHEAKRFFQQAKMIGDVCQRKYGRRRA